MIASLRWPTVVIVGKLLEFKSSYLVQRCDFALGAKSATKFLIFEFARV